MSGFSLWYIQKMICWTSRDMVVVVTHCSKRIIEKWHSFSERASDKQGYLYFIKSAIFSILVSKNKWLVVAVWGWKLIIWSAFSWSFKIFLKCSLFSLWPQISQAYMKWFGQKSQRFSNDAFQSYYDHFQVNWLVQIQQHSYKSS